MASEEEEEEGEDEGKEGRKLKEEQCVSGLNNSATVPNVHQPESCEGWW